MNNKVCVKLEQDEDGYPPANVETIVASCLGEDRFRLAGIPFFANQVAVHDIVSCQAGEDGRNWVWQLVEDGGHATIRVVVADISDMPGVRDECARRGCNSEVKHHLPGFVAIDVPPETNIEGLVGWLQGERERSRLDYEVGKWRGGAAQGSVSPTVRGV
jgi:hypothetical protein